MGTSESDFARALLFSRWCVCGIPVLDAPGRSRLADSLLAACYCKVSLTQQSSLLQRFQIFKLLLGGKQQSLAALPGLLGLLQFLLGLFLGRSSSLGMLSMLAASVDDRTSFFQDFVCPLQGLPEEVDGFHPAAASRQVKSGGV